MAHFFIRRPVFAWVIAIAIMLGGLLGLAQLSVSRYPDIAHSFAFILGVLPLAVASGAARAHSARSALASWAG